MVNQKASYIFIVIDFVFVTAFRLVDMVACLKRNRQDNVDVTIDICYRFVFEVMGPNLD
jgi:hypothetical protein